MSLRLVSHCLGLIQTIEKGVGSDQGPVVEPASGIELVGFLEGSQRLVV